MKKILMLSVLALSLTGCMAIPPLNFTPPDGSVVIEKEQRIDAELKTITVSAAKANEQLGDIQVGFAGNVYEGSLKDTFKASLEEAILKSALFRDDASKKVGLIAKFMKLDTPGMSINFKTHVIVRYQIIDRSTSDIIYDKNIESVGEVPFDHAFMGAVRHSEARNRAMQNNIAKFLNDLKVRGIEKK